MDNMKNVVRREIALHLLFLSALALFMPAAAFAHAGFGHQAGFLAGFGHPVSGFDHMLAAFAVGMWASQLGNRAVFLVPGAFVALMLAGAAADMSGAAVSFVEGGILVSVLTIGLLIVAATRMPLYASMAIVGFFALFHGLAHGAEASALASSGYWAGLILATALVHVLGVGVGAVFQRISGARLVRYAGATIALAGASLFLA
jgi:urease accessory protein